MVCSVVMLFASFVWMKNGNEINLLCHILCHLVFYSFLFSEIYTQPHRNFIAFRSCKGGKYCKILNVWFEDFIPSVHFRGRSNFVPLHPKRNFQLSKNVRRWSEWSPFEVNGRPFSGMARTSFSTFVFLSFSMRQFRRRKMRERGYKRISQPSFSLSYFSWRMDKGRS